MDTHAAAPADASGLEQPYHLVDPSPWPLAASFAGALFVFGIVLGAHEVTWNVMYAGIAAIFVVMYFWWRDVVRESRTPGLHTGVVRVGLRYGMTLFIASEVMFFVAFFWAFFHYSLFPEHIAGQEVAIWPPQGIYTFDPWGLPFLNTMILLLSGTTITWAHQALLQGNRRAMMAGLGLTILLGLSFTTLQAVEYAEAPFAFTDGIYPSVFFLATGFHGFHVMVGTVFLIVCFLRGARGHFTPERHFGFEAAAWYWHFVDVVWLFLFVCIYWWGAGQIMQH